VTAERLCLLACVNPISAERVDAGDGVFRAFDGPGLARLRRARSVRGGFSAPSGPVGWE